MQCRSGHQRSEPFRIGKRIRIQECDEIAVLESFDGSIVRNRKSDVLTEGQDVKVGAEAFAPTVNHVESPVAAATIDEDHPIGRLRLLVNGLQAAIDVPLGIEGDDDEADPHGNGAATSSPAGPAASNGVSMMPLGPAERTQTRLPFWRAPTLTWSARSHGSGLTASAGSGRYD